MRTEKKKIWKYFQRVKLYVVYKKINLKLFVLFSFIYLSIKNQ